MSKEQICGKCQLKNLMAHSDRKQHIRNIVTGAMKSTLHYHGKEPFQDCYQSILKRIVGDLTDYLEKRYS